MYPHIYMFNTHHHHHHHHHHHNHNSTTAYSSALLVAVCRYVGRIESLRLPTTNFRQMRALNNKSKHCTTSRTHAAVIFIGLLWCSSCKAANFVRAAVCHPCEPYALCQQRPHTPQATAPSRSPKMCGVRGDNGAESRGGAWRQLDIQYVAIAWVYFARALVNPCVCSHRVSLCVMYPYLYIDSEDLVWLYH